MRLRAVAGICSALLMPALVCGQSSAIYLPGNVAIYPSGVGFINAEGVAEYQSFRPRPKPRQPPPKSRRIVDDKGHVTVQYQHTEGRIDENGTPVLESYAAWRRFRPGVRTGGAQYFTLAPSDSSAETIGNGLEIRKSGGGTGPAKPSVPKPAPKTLLLQQGVISIYYAFASYPRFISLPRSLWETPLGILNYLANDPQVASENKADIPGVGTGVRVSYALPLPNPTGIRLVAFSTDENVAGTASLDCGGGIFLAPNVSCNGPLNDANGHTITMLGLYSGPTGNFLLVQSGGQPSTTPLIERSSEASSHATQAADTIDPISTATGEMLAGPFTDLDLGGLLPGALVVRRSYGTFLAGSTGPSALGVNWLSNLDPYVAATGKVALVALEGGGSTSFQLNGSAYTTVFPARMAFQLVKNASGYRYLDPGSDRIYTFDTTGRLIKIEDRNGNAVTITRAGSLGLVSQVSDGLGRTLTYTYNSSAHLTKVQDQTGRSVTYSQDANNGLASVTDANGNTTTYNYALNELTKTVLPRGNAPYTQTYDPQFGLAVAQSDSEGNTTTLSYVDGGTPGKTVMTDPLGRKTTFNYPDFVDLSSFTDAAGGIGSYTYDSMQRLLTSSDRLGNKTAVTYDTASGYMASITDAQGNTTSFTYQPQVQGDFTFYNLAQITYADSTTESFTYDGSGNVSKSTDRSGKATSYTYNPQGQVLTETNEAGGVTTYTYNADATLATEKVPSGDVTTYSYDNLKRVAKIQYADKTSVSFTRDAVDQVLSITGERGKVTKFGYDSNNNFQSLTDALSQTSKLTYDTDDLPVTATDPLGNTTKVQYDPLGSATAITNPAGEKTTFAYDNLERVKSVADPTGKGSSYTYDAEGRLVSTTNAVGNTWSIKVNKNGVPTQLTSPLSETTAISYDALNRVTGITDALGRVSAISYENRGLPSVLTSPGGLTTSLAWGDLPLLKSVADPNGNQWSIARDNLGRATAATDPLGQALAYTYDARSRISSVTSPIDSVQIAYDAAGNISLGQFSDGVTLKYTYDDNNRLTGGTGFSLAYDAAGRVIGSNGLAITHDPAGRIASITYAPGKTVTYKRDSRGLLASVADWTGGSVAFTFDNAHRLVSLTRSNGLVTTYTYDADGRVASITDTAGGGTLSSISLTRDAIGRFISSDRNVPQEAAPASANVSFSYDAANQLSGDTYDARGRLAKDSSGAKYQWSAASRLVSYTRPDGSASFTYDGLGQRISRTGSDGSTVNYVLNYSSVLPAVATVQSGGSDVTYYVYTPGGALLYSIDATSGTHRFYSFDEVGSTIFLTDDKAAITDTYGVSPYGDVITAGASNKTSNPFTWQGQLGVMQEAGTSLSYARLRYYDAGSSRFLSRDPLFSVAPREINLYQYAAGNPVTNGDPWGLKPKTIASSPAAPPTDSRDLPSLLAIALVTSGVAFTEHAPGPRPNYYGDPPKLNISLPDLFIPTEPPPDLGLPSILVIP